MDTSAISIKKLSKVYPTPFPRVRKFFRLQVKPEVQALTDVSLEIRQGEIFGLIGKNGAGKTTLTKIIATLVQPTGGSISVLGVDTVKDEVKVRSQIGLATAEERSFYWRLSCRQNLLFFSRLNGMTDTNAKKRIDELFERFDLAQYEKRRFSELSTGNKQKLAVARALLSKPKILLLDEPTRSLDPLAAASMRNLISSLKGVSILLTSHNLSEIDELCDRMAVISKGVIRAIGTPDELRNSHKQKQTVKISLKANAFETFQTLNNLRDVEIEETPGLTTIKFSRETDDNLLGQTVADLAKTKAQIVDIETEKPTLLDVLESYD